MRNITEALDEFFVYNKDLSDRGQSWVDYRTHRQNDKYNKHFNKKYDRKDLGYYCIVPQCLNLGKKGFSLTLYTNENHLKLEGQLCSGIFEKYSDCAFMRYGLELSLMAFISELPLIHDLTLSYTNDHGSGSIPFNYREDMALTFLEYVTGLDEKTLKKEVQPELQTALF